jgi:3-phenylpropionate/cinnamic acid dioxygenase small subunit
MTDGMAGLEQHFRIERFLQREADLLDRRAFHQWLALLAEDVVYRVSVRQIRDAASGHRDIAIIDETAAGLKSRIDQMSNPRLTHAENPTSLTRRFVTLIEARCGETAELFVVRSNILIHRVRPEDAAGRLFAGERSDLIRLDVGGCRIVERHVHLDHAVIHGGPLTLLF